MSKSLISSDMLDIFENGKTSGSSFTDSELEIVLFISYIYSIQSLMLNSPHTVGTLSINVNCSKSTNVSLMVGNC